MPLKPHVLLPKSTFFHIVQIQKHLPRASYAFWEGNYPPAISYEDTRSVFPSFLPSRPQIWLMTHDPSASPHWQEQLRRPHGSSLSSLLVRVGGSSVAPTF